MSGCQLTKMSMSTCMTWNLELYEGSFNKHHVFIFIRNFPACLFTCLSVWLANVKEQKQSCFKILPHNFFLFRNKSHLLWNIFLGLTKFIESYNKRDTRFFCCENHSSSSAAFRLLENIPCWSYSQPTLNLQSQPTYKG